MQYFLITRNAPNQLVRVSLGTNFHADLRIDTRRERETENKKKFLVLILSRDHLKIIISLCGIL